MTNVTPLTRNIIIWVNLISVLILAGLGLWFYEQQRVAQKLADEEKPWMSYINSPFPVESPVMAGRVIPMSVRRHNDSLTRRIYPVAASLISEDHPGQAPMALTVNNVYVDAGDTLITSVINRTPIETPPGWYHLEGIGEIHGEHHVFLIPWASQPFQVIAPPQ